MVHSLPHRSRTSPEKSRVYFTYSSMSSTGEFHTHAHWLYTTQHWCSYRQMTAMLNLGAPTYHFRTEGPSTEKLAYVHQITWLGLLHQMLCYSIDGFHVVITYSAKKGMNRWQKFGACKINREPGEKTLPTITQLIRDWRIGSNIRVDLLITWSFTYQDKLIIWISRLIGHLHIKIIWSFECQD